MLRWSSTTRSLPMILETAEDRSTLAHALREAHRTALRARALKRHSSPTDATLLPALWNCAKRSPHETQRVPIRYVKSREPRTAGGFAARRGSAHEEQNEQSDRETCQTDRVAEHARGAQASPRSAPRYPRLARFER